LRLGAQDMVAKTDEDVAREPGAAIGVGFDAAAMHWFDAASGTRIGAAL
jgi:hypothetical protein